MRDRTRVRFILTNEKADTNTITCFDSNIPIVF